MKYLLLLVLLCGCAYTSRTTISGNKIKTPYGAGDVLINREMTLSIFCKKEKP